MVLRAGLLRLRADRLAAAARATTRTGPPMHGNTRIQATWITRHLGRSCCALVVFGTVRAGRRPTARARARARPDLEAGRHRRCRSRSSASSGGSPTGTRSSAGSRPPQLRAAGQPVGPVQRDLAGRDPQLLGLPARGEGRRQPRREQRRLHQAQAPRPGHRALRRAVRPVARRDVRLRPGRCRLRAFQAWASADASRSWPRSPRSCRRTRRPTTRRWSRTSTRPWPRPGIAGGERLLLPASTGPAHERHRLRSTPCRPARRRGDRMAIETQPEQAQGPAAAPASAPAAPALVDAPRRSTRARRRRSSATSSATCSATS